MSSSIDRYREDFERLQKTAVQIELAFAYTIHGKRYEEAVLESRGYGLCRARRECTGSPAVRTAKSARWKNIRCRDSMLAYNSARSFKRHWWSKGAPPYNILDCIRLEVIATRQVL